MIEFFFRKIFFSVSEKIEFFFFAGKLFSRCIYRFSSLMFLSIVYISLINLINLSIVQNCHRKTSKTSVKFYPNAIISPSDLPFPELDSLKFLTNLSRRNWRFWRSVSSNSRMKCSCREFWRSARTWRRSNWREFEFRNLRIRTRRRCWRRFRRLSRVGFLIFFSKIFKNFPGF